MGAWFPLPFPHNVSNDADGSQIGLDRLTCPIHRARHPAYPHYTYPRPHRRPICLWLLLTDPG